MKYLYAVLPLMLLVINTTAAKEVTMKSWDIILHDCKIIEDENGSIRLQCPELECAERMRKAMKEIAPYLYKGTAIHGAVLTQFQDTMKECAQ